MQKYWYKNAIIYSLHVESFMDSNGDGIGDFKGLTSSLNYLSDLGVNCIWLLPFFTSPNKDHGYDVVDYYNVDPRYGTLGHFVEFLSNAEARGIRVLVDLVLNHTSVEHPWFQEARKGKDNKYHDYYIWVDEKPRLKEDKNMVGRGDNWAWDAVAGRYYYHTFYEHQADLNISNPLVQEEIKYIFRFWLRLGVSGFRLDAVPHMLATNGNMKWTNSPFQFLKDLRTCMEEYRPDGMLLAEADTKPKKYLDYFGNSDQIQMLFNFHLNNNIFLCLAKGEAKSIKDAFDELPLEKLTIAEQMATFLRNHDELDLIGLDKKERDLVFEVFAPEEHMRIYGRGIRRRLAPLLNNDRRKLELLHSLLFSLPGTPVMRYGDEIGMGDDLSLKERNSVRTAMQWTEEPNAGFSSAQGHVEIPIIRDGAYGYPILNVHTQLRDPNSLLNVIKRMIDARMSCKEFGLGTHEFLKTGHKGVLAHCCTQGHGLSLALHNFTGEEVWIKAPLDEDNFSHLLECFADQSYEPYQSGQELRLAPYGYRWFTKSTLLTIA